MKTYILCIWLGWATIAAGQQQELLVNNPEFASLLGYDVAIEGEFAVVGAPFHGGFGSNHAGAAYVFQLVDGTWTNIKKLLPPWGGAKGDDFGISVDITENRVIIGARHVNHGDKLRVGAAYIFAQSGDDWILEGKLAPADGESEDGFGASVGISGTKAIVGSPGNDELGVGSGAAYVFQLKSYSWSQIAKLKSADIAADDQFGTTVAFDDNLAVVGAPGNKGVEEMKSGAAYVFDCSAISTRQIARLTASDASILDHFGKAVDIDQGAILVGAPFANDKVGKAYVFAEHGNRWRQQAILEPNDGDSFDKFGHAVGLTLGRAIVGTLRERAYLFAQSGATWSQDDIIMSDDGLPGDEFAHAVDIDQIYSIVGAPHHTHDVAKEGAAYVNGPFALPIACHLAMTLSGTISPKVYSALDHIVVEGTVMPGGVSLHSGNYMLFKSGFTILTGSELLVATDGCQ